jgi:protoporphyrinogen oxidase/nucleoside-diphosphate-sugar epimerase
MRVLVTGGAGFVGSHLCERLINAGNEVWCLDNLWTGSRENLCDVAASPRFHFIESDVRDAFPDLEFDRIYNLACPASPRHYQADPIGTTLTSVLGVQHALDHCRRVGARLLQTSTSEIYGDPEVHPQTEDYVGAVSCVGRRACYDEGKRVAETLCYDHHRKHGTEIRVARLFNTYGPRMSPDDGRVVPNFIVQAVRNEPITIYGAGTQTRSFCFIDDMIDALTRLMEAPGSRIGPMNLGNPGEFTVRELAELVRTKTGSTSATSYHDLPEDDPRIRRPDISLARETLGWEPTVALDQGLDRTIRWYQSRYAVPVSAGEDRAGHTGIVAIIGGGPAGLTAAYSLQKAHSELRPIVLEASNGVGGISRTETYKGYRFDIGGHRFFSKVPAVMELWKEVLGPDFLRRPRLSRIFYKGKYYSYPLKLFNALSNIGVYESARIVLSYLKWRLRPHVDEENFEQWVTNRFGGRVFWHFFKTYTEKVWGMPCTEIRADWAAQRIKNLSLRKAVLNAVTGRNDTTSLIENFDYPRLGPGMMWEAFGDRIRESGGEIRLNSSVTKIRYDGDVVRQIECEGGYAGRDDNVRLMADHFISSMPITDLVRGMDPPAPPSILAAADELRYRDFLIVVLILKGTDPFPDNWIYIHSPEVKVGRIQNFRSWSPEMVPNADTSSIGMEYFCQEGDALWTSNDGQLIDQAKRELAHLGLAGTGEAVDGTVIRQSKAYPVYDGQYRQSLDMIRGWLARFKNLQVVGRNGMHRYNNQDHSMMTAILAVQNLLGADHDLWSVNVDKEYHEDIESAANLNRARGSATL